MDTQDYVRFDGLGLAELVAGGEVSSKELASCATQLIEAKDPAINSVLSTLEGQPFSPDQPFSGVPFLIKELILQAEGAPSRSGSRAPSASPAKADSNLMQRFRAAGLQLVGTTQTPEMGYNATTETVAFGPVHNPWRAGHSAGGSSGGSGAAVAAGFVPIAHANDGGGSIRIPAACNGLVGLKPTRDRIPTGPAVSDPLFGQAIEFVVTRSVRDCAALLDCVAGPDMGAAHIIAPPPESFAQAAEKPPGALKIGVINGTVLGTELDPENAAAVNNAAALCAHLGCDLIDCDFSLDFEEFAQHINVLWCVFAAQFVAQLSQAPDVSASNDYFEEVTLTCADFGANSSALDVLGALDYVNRISRQTAALFADVDCLLSATTATPPPAHGVLNQNQAGMSAMDWTRQTFRYAANTPLFNATGQPAISLHLHWSASGLPVGVQFAGRMGDEGTLLSLAGALEVAAYWRNKQISLMASSTIS